jgi:NDP-sugar pyrophosphorylase family protein
MIKAFILSAGFSTRLRPITEHIPKPLLPLAGEVLLEYVYRLLKLSGAEQIGINLHYKAEQIEKFIRNSNLEATLFHEREILNTGGALYNAKDFLKDSIFIVHNADIYWDGNIKNAINEHIKRGNAITLLVHDHAPDNKLFIDEEGNFKGIKSKTFKTDSSINSILPVSRQALAFTGVAIYSPEVLDFLPEGPSSVIDLWLKAENKGLKVRGFLSKYNFWHDIGTPHNYARAVFDKLKRNFSSLYVAPDSSGCELIKTEGYVVIEKDVKIKKPFTGKNIIILPHTEFKANEEDVSDCIICRDLIISISGWQNQREALTHGGSTRRYFREKGRVICEWDKISDEFEKTVHFGKFLRDKGFPVPEIIHINRFQNLIIFEDLGDLTLYSWLQCKRKKEEILAVYKQIIEKIINLHWKISYSATKFEIILPEFDYDYFRWESDYFLKECVSAVFGIKISEFSNDFKEGLKGELDSIAEKLSKAEKVILHRDLQSQNIMLKDNKVYFIDYQSARWGPSAYDLASLLWDPYVELEEEIRQELVNLYIHQALSLQPSASVSPKSHGLIGASLRLQPETFTEELSLCRIQRHMQALGAYGFLALKKGKRNFLKFIPSALKMLYQDIQECPIELLALKELVYKLKNKLPHDSSILSALKSFKNCH